MLKKTTPKASCTQFHNETSTSVSLMSRDWITTVNSFPTVIAHQGNNYGDQRAAKRRAGERAVTSAYKGKTNLGRIYISS
jgi:hypothetical protein